MNCLTIATIQALRRRIEKIINYVFESLTPSLWGHSPYLIYDEQRERIENGISRFGTKIALYPSPLSHNTTGHGWGEGIKKTQRYLHRPVIILQKTASDEVPVFGYKCGVSVGKAGIGK